MTDRTERAKALNPDDPDQRYRYSDLAHDVILQFLTAEKVQLLRHLVQRRATAPDPQHVKVEPEEFASAATFLMLRRVLEWLETVHSPTISPREAHDSLALEIRELAAEAERAAKKGGVQ